MGINAFIAQIQPFPFNFAPRYWAQCNGQFLPINQNQALFSLLGTTYGGNGVTTFALPDLRGCAPMGFGAGPGLSSRNLGQRLGEENHILLSTEMPAHTHTVAVAKLEGDSTTPAGNIPAKSGVGDPRFGQPTGAGVATMTATVAAGASQPHSNMMPYLVLNYCICTAGIFPSHP